MNTPREQYIQINGLRFHYLEWGKKGNPTILVLHGLMCHAHVWDDLAADLSRQYYVLALDQRGHGDSEWSKRGCYDLDSHFSDIKLFVEVLDLDHLILLGHSMGGRNALFYAACVPEKVKRLILVDARPGNNPQAAGELKRQLGRLPVQPGSIDEAVQAFKKLYPFIPIGWCRYLVEYGYERSDDGQLVSKYDILMTKQLEASDYEAEDLWYMLENILCPTLIVRGQDSPFLSREDAINMTKIMPNAVFREIPHSTHMPAQENPKAFKKMVFDFLEG